MLNRTKKIFGILLAFLFVGSLTLVAAVSAQDYNERDHDMGWYMNNGYHRYNDRWYDDNWYHSHNMKFDEDSDRYYHNNYHWWMGKWQDDKYEGEFDR